MIPEPAPRSQDVRFPATRARGDRAGIHVLCSSTDWSTQPGNSGCRQRKRSGGHSLRPRGLLPVKVAPLAAGGGTLRRGRRIRARYVSVFFAQLADLLASGVPLLRSLEILERQGSQPALGVVVREVRKRVADGTGLAEAMAQFPEAFNELAISMVHAGQEGGFLEDVLRRIADFTEHQEDLKAKVVGALAYPVFLAVVGFVVLNVLVVAFVPKFEPMFQKLQEKGELPVVTQVLMGTSHMLQRQGWWMIVVAGVAFYSFRSWIATDSGRLWLDGWRLRIPAAGAIYLHLALSRFRESWALCFTTASPSFRHCGSPRIPREIVCWRKLSKSADNIQAGETLATPLAACPHFPRDMVEMISVGEESNDLERVLVDVADGLEKRTTRQLDLLLRLLEPLMLLVMAAITLVVVAGLLLPVFKMSSTVK